MSNNGDGNGEGGGGGGGVCGGVLAWGPWQNGMLTDCFISVVLKNILFIASLIVFIVTYVNLRNTRLIVRLWDRDLKGIRFSVQTLSRFFGLHISTRVQYLQFIICISSSITPILFLIFRAMAMLAQPSSSSPSSSSSPTVSRPIYTFEVVDDILTSLSWAFLTSVVCMHSNRGKAYPWYVRSWWLASIIVHAIALQAFDDDNFRLNRELVASSGSDNDDDEMEAPTQYKIQLTKEIFMVLASTAISILGLWLNSPKWTRHVISVPIGQENDEDIHSVDPGYAAVPTQSLLQEEMAELEREAEVVKAARISALEERNKFDVQPQKSAGFFSRITFWWVQPLLSLGSARPLRLDDLWIISERDHATITYNKVNEAWSDIRAAHPDSRGPVTLTRALFKAFGGPYLFAGCMKLCADLTQFVAPYLLSQLIIFIGHGGDDQGGIMKGLGIVSLMATCMVLQALFNNAYMFRIFREGTHVRSAVVSLVYRKSLRISNSARQSYTVGEIVNLQAVDAERIKQVLQHLHWLWAAPLMIIICLVFLWRLVGIATLGGLAVMVLILPLNVLIARTQAGLQKQILKQKDQRLKLTTEILNGIRVIKFFAWEPSFQEKLRQTRDAELATLRKIQFLRAVSQTLLTSSPVFVAVITFTVLALTSERTGVAFTAQTVFPALALFNILRKPLDMLPMVIAGVIEARVSMERVARFLLADEIEPTMPRRTASLSGDEREVAVDVKNAEFWWNDVGPSATLSEISFQIKRNELVAVVGPVGAGKSSLLSALLGNIPKKEGHVTINGNIAYVPQQSWMQNASLRDNILFGKEYDEERYRSCVSACQLGPDLQILPQGDATEIGERGINLSGGQKQRVACARAMFHDADIILMDDPLSAVDAHVGSALFNEFVCGPLQKEKTRILVTHQLHVLPRVDRVIVMDAGRIVDVGTFADLMAKGGTFADMVNNHILSTESSPTTNGGHVTTPNREEIAVTVDKSASSSTTSGSSGPKEKGQLIKEELKNEGSVNWSIYRRYYDGIGGWPVVVLILLALVIDFSFRIGGDWWLSAWSDADTAETSTAINSNSNSNSTMTSTSSSTSSSSVIAYDEDSRQANMMYYLKIYVVIGCLVAVFTSMRTFAVAYAGLRSAKAMHMAMFNAVLHAPTRFFDTTPLGRILNRFSKDQYYIDENLPNSLQTFLYQTFVVMSVLVVVCSVTPFFLVMALPLSYAYYSIQQYYLATSRELQRLDSISKSPIFAQFSETLTGISTIRAFNMADRFTAQNDGKIDVNTRPIFGSISINRWLSQRLEFTCALLVTVAALFAVLGRDNLDPGLVGLSLTYALNLTGLLNLLVRSSADVEVQLVSVERLAEYADLEQEGPHYIPPPSLLSSSSSSSSATPNRLRNKRPSILGNGHAPSSGEWPSLGKIEFRDLSMRYRPGLDLVLRGVSCVIHPREKIGVVGRTGAGKSSLVLALFRTVVPENGAVLIDDRDISTVHLHDLRSNLSIIPQDPTLFAGTIRSNLDPFRAYYDDELWHALEAVSLRGAIEAMEGGLDAVVFEGGDNLSVGQRQLMCLGRALLKQVKILVMDEATASVDLDTDVLIQRTIRERFADRTVLTIAHRINTIIDSDRVIVLDKGQIAEFDTPKNLVSNPSSIFYSLVHEAGLLGTMS